MDRAEQVRRRRAGKARVARLESAAKDFPVTALALANAVVGTPRTWSGDVKRQISSLARNHDSVTEALKRTHAPFDASSRKSLVPFVIVGYYLADMLAQLTQPPHQITDKFVDLALDAERNLNGW